MDASNHPRNADGRPSATYRVRVDQFEGPFDLLLQLITARELDIWRVDLAGITADLLRHLGLDGDDARRPEGFDLETATHVLVLAATLVELKAARLLPVEADEELDELLAEARDLLYARLLEYRAFRDAGRVLGAALTAGDARAGRQVPLEPRFRDLIPETPIPVDPAGLGALAACALAPRPRPHVDVGHIQAPALSVRAAAERILRRLAATTTFAHLVAGLGVPDRIAHFLALLDLYKSGRVGLEQPDLAGSLTVTPTGGGGGMDEHR